MSILRWNFRMLFFSVLLVSCTKESDDTAPVVSREETGNYSQILADSLYKYAQQIYYWNSFLPDSAVFKPLGYAHSDTLSGLENELLAITRLAINPATGKSYEQYQSYSNGVVTDINILSKYSNVSLTSDLYDGGVLSNVISHQKKVADLKMTLDGRENELGVSVGFAPVSYLSGTSKAMPAIRQDSIVGMIRLVTKGSPAWSAGVRRGDIIAKVNGNSWNYASNAKQISSALNANSITLTIFDPAAQTYKDHSFSKSLYTFDPLYKDTLITVGSKKIAYIAYKAFTDESNTKPAIERAFGKFADATDLVIDLRYNGGGYVSSAEYLANMILPSGKNGDVLFKEIYNSTMQNRQATILRNQPVYLNNVKQNYSYFAIDFSEAGNTTKVQKEGSFNSSGTITNLYFIVSSNTASASELLINSLKPYFSSVYLINAPFSATDNPNYTYGKPIGFFEIRLGKYSVYMANFESKNKNNEGGYYQGIKTDLRSRDDMRYELGDPNESAFLAAIRRITGDNSYQPAATVGRSVLPNSTVANGIVLVGTGSPTKIFDMVSQPKAPR